MSAQPPEQLPLSNRGRPRAARNGSPMDNHHTPPPSTGAVARRTVLSSTAAVAAAVAAAGLTVLATGTPALARDDGDRGGSGGGGGGWGHGRLRAEPLIPSRNRGIILYSVRDRIAAAPDTSGVPYGFE